MRLRHFKLKEFDSPDQAGSGVLMNQEFLRLLDDAREGAGIPFRITSGYRTILRNDQLRSMGYKASENSSHLRGLAADIAVTSDRNRLIIIGSLLEVGIRRIGASSTFVHCDIDTTKPTPRMWLY